MARLIRQPKPSGECSSLRSVAGILSLALALYGTVLGATPVGATSSPPTWTQLSPTTSPSARYAASMAYDPASRHLLLFGGYSSSNLGDTWVYTPPVPDTAAPTTTISLTPRTPTGQNTWYTSAVTVSVSAKDQDDASTTLTTRCVLDPTTPPTSFSALPSGSCPYAVSGGAAVSKDGKHTLYAASEDPFGNMETPVQRRTFQLDQTPPSGVTATPDRAPNAHGWYTSPVRVSAPNATDATSGLASCTSPTYSGPDSATASLTVTCTDHAGNSASATYHF